MREIDVERSFPLEGVTGIRVHMPAAGIHVIRAEAGGQARFHLYGRAMVGVGLDAVVSGRTIVVREDRLFRWFWPGRLRLDVHVPEGRIRELSIRSASGAVRMDPMELEECRVELASGGLEADALASGTLCVRAASGSIRIGRVTAREMDIRTVSSSIHIDACAAQKANVQSVSGGLRLQDCVGDMQAMSISGALFLSFKELKERTVRLESTSGSISLELPRDADVLTDARTTSGRIRSDFPMNGMDEAAGAPRARVSVRTTSGSISIRKG
jgi:lia operon protein LiaG